MKIIKKDVNKSLLLLVMFFLVLFISFTVYYQIALRDVVKEKSHYDRDLGMITAQLILERLNKSDNLKELALLDKAVLEYKYNELAAENENLRNEIKSLKGEITLLKSEIEYNNIRIEGPVAQFRAIQDKNQQIRQLQEKIELLCKALKSRNISEPECR